MLRVCMAIGLCSLLAGCSPFSGFGRADMDAGERKGGWQGDDGRVDAALPDGGGGDASDIDAGMLHEPQVDAGPDAGPAAVSETLLATCGELQRMQDDPTKSYGLQKSINCTGYAGFVPIGNGTAPFTGSFDGHGHAITGLRIEGASEVGLFGIARGALLRRVALIAADMVGNTRVGALVGSAEEGTRIEQVSASGAVTAVLAAGGIAGRLEASSLRDSHASVNVQSVKNRGGLLAGESTTSAQVAHSYANSSVSGTTGRLTGDGYASMQAAFFDCGLAGGCSASDGTALSSVALQTPGTFVYAGWDFTTPIWGTVEQLSAPCLIWETGCSRYALGGVALKGQGTADEPYTIESCAQLQAMAIARSAVYELATDVDCGGFDFGDGRGFLPVGDATRRFTGSFDGKGFVIRNVRILRPSVDHVGVFGYAHGARITGLQLENAAILGRKNVGVIAGTAEQVVVIDCKVQGVVGAKQVAGVAIGNPVSGTPLPACSGSVATFTLL